MILQGVEPFARGGNRLCFVHPEDPGLCVKVRRPDFTLEDLRRKKGFPKNLRPLSSFDDNREEFRVVRALKESYGDGVFAHVYRCHEFVETDLGAGLVTELIRDGNGKISVSLKQYLWEAGYTPQCREAVRRLSDFWLELLIPSRDLLTHNIVVQCDAAGNIVRTVVIDGLGSATVIPFQWLPRPFRTARVKKKIGKLNERIDQFLDNCAAGKAPSRVGMLIHRDED